MRPSVILLEPGHISINTITHEEENRVILKNIRVNLGSDYVFSNISADCIDYPSPQTVQLISDGIF
jgi:hypothetical protein